LALESSANSPQYEMDDLYMTAQLNCINKNSFWKQFHGVGRDKDTNPSEQTMFIKQKPGSIAFSPGIFGKNPRRSLSTGGVSH
jgi:hypothetical protein